MCNHIHRHSPPVGLVVPLHGREPVQPVRIDGPTRDALARLEIATRMRNPAAVARILDGLAEHEGGRWLLTQITGAGLRHMASTITGVPGSERR
jgi:hypothetical protein